MTRAPSGNSHLVPFQLSAHTRERFELLCQESDVDRHQAIGDLLREFVADDRSLSGYYPHPLAGPVSVMKTCKVRTTLKDEFLEQLRGAGLSEAEALRGLVEREFQRVDEQEAAGWVDVCFELSRAVPQQGWGCCLHGIRQALRVPGHGGDRLSLRVFDTCSDRVVALKLLPYDERVRIRDRVDALRQWEPKARLPRRCSTDRLEPDALLVLFWEEAADALREQEQTLEGLLERRGFVGSKQRLEREAQREKEESKAARAEEHDSGMLG